MEIAIPIIIFFFGLLVSAIIYIWKKMDSKISEIETEQKEIKENYLTRFENISNKIHELDTKVINAINELKLLIIEYKNKK